MPADCVLQTWKETSEYVGRTQRTVQRWEQQFGFPVHRPAGKPRSSVMALGQEIQEWTRGRPSLVSIRQSPRLSRAKLLAEPPAEHDWGNDLSQNSADALHTVHAPQSGSGDVLPDIILENKYVRARLAILLQQHKRLRNKIKQNRERRRFF